MIRIEGSKKKITALVTPVVLLFAASLLLINLNKPFIGQHDWNSVVYSQQARNYLRYGYRILRFAPIDNAGMVTDRQEFRYSTHYPPLLPILLSFSFRLFGVHEWSARLVPILFSLGALFLVMKLGALLVNKTVGWWAALLMAVTPLFIYYGRIPVHESVVPAAALLTFYLYFRWRESRQRGLFLALIGSLIFAELLGWPGYYPAGIIVIHYWFTQRRSNLKRLDLRRLDLFPMFWLVVVSAVVFLLFLWYSAPLRGMHQPSLWEIFWLRAGVGSKARAWPFTWPEYLTHELHAGVRLMTVVLLSLSAIWVLRLTVRIVRRRAVEQEVELGLLAVFGLIQLLLFRNLAWLHEYMVIYSLPFVALSAAGVLVMIFRGRWYLFLPVLALVMFERAGYAKALLRSEYHRQVYEEAVRINRQTEIDEVVQPQVEIGNAGFLFNFYADRKRE